MKAVKVNYLGSHIATLQPRNKQTGQFMTKNNKEAKLALKVLIAIALLTLLVYIGGPIVNAWIDNKDAELDYKAGLSASTTPIVAVFNKPSFEERVREAKQKMLDELAYECEVKGSNEPEGVIILDSNSEMSIGKYQYQRATVKHFVKHFYGKEITNDEAVAIAVGWHPDIDLDELTLKVLFEEVPSDQKQGWENWYNCGNKINLAQQIEIIKNIEG